MLLGIEDFKFDFGLGISSCIDIVDIVVVRGLKNLLLAVFLKPPLAIPNLFGFDLFFLGFAFLESAYSVCEGIILVLLGGKDVLLLI
jgi:hypothetical protein